MAISKATARWEGTLKEGKGTMKPANAPEAPYSLGTRFEGKPGSSPEELIGAALAGCYSMALSKQLGAEGFTPRSIQTSATVLPIRPNGDRPALHVIGANGSFTRDDVPWDVIEQAESLHLGGPEFMHELAPEILAFCREHGVRTSADVLADGWPELLDMIAPALEQVDWFLPNDDQAMKLTGADDAEAAGRALVERGVGGCAITCGAAGSAIVTADGAERVPAFQIEVVDTTGCGDAFSAGFMRGLSLGRSPADSARLGSACASLVAQGLGSDAGEFDLEAADGFAAQTPIREA